MSDKITNKILSSGNKNPRHAAYLIIYSVFQNKLRSEEAINKILKQYRFESRDRSLAVELAKGTVKRKLTLDHVIERFTGSRFKQTPVEIILLLRLGIYQLLYVGSVPEYAAVDETVNLCSVINNKLKGFVNAILRNVIRNKSKLIIAEKNPVILLSVKHSFPQWLIRRWLENYGKENTEIMCDFFNKPFEVCLRTNRTKIDRENLIELLEETGTKCRKGDFSPDAIYCKKLQDIGNKDVFREGLFFIQGEASMLVSEVLNPAKGTRVLDMCAAPGGKATHCAEIMGDEGEIVAADTNSDKLRLIKESAKRLELTSITTCLSGKTKESSIYDPEGFNYILIDAPCSGLGILRKNADSRWNKGESNIKALMRIQLKLMERGYQLLKKQGELVYSVCTFTSEENEKVIYSFLKNHSDMKIVNLKKSRNLRKRINTPNPEIYDSFFTDDGFLKILPFKHDLEGFFVAKLRKG